MNPLLVQALLALAAFLLAWVVARITTPELIKAAIRFGIVDRPEWRSVKNCCR